MKEICLLGNDAVHAKVRAPNSFWAYLKSKERGRLNRRGIASPISTGEEKKAKIIAELSTINSFTNGTTLLTQTEDKTKFNECLAPEAFYFLHHILLDTKKTSIQSLRTITKFVSGSCPRNSFTRSRDTSVIRGQLSPHTNGTISQGLQ